MPDLNPYIAPEGPTGRGPLQAAEPRSFHPVDHESLTFPFLAGRIELSVRLTARPMFDLRRREAVGIHISRTLSRATAPAGPFGGSRPRLEPADISRLDAVALAQGLTLPRPAAPGVVAAPACWSTVTASRGRFGLLYAGMDHKPDLTRLLIEIIGAPAGVPERDLADAASHLHAQRRGVIVRSPLDPAAAIRLGQAGAGGVSLDLSPLDLKGAAAWRRSEHLIRSARAAAPCVLLLGLSPERAETAAQAGATHAVMAQGFAVTV